MFGLMNLSTRLFDELIRSVSLVHVNAYRMHCINKVIGLFCLSVGIRRFKRTWETLGNEYTLSCIYYHNSLFKYPLIQEIRYRSIRNSYLSVCIEATIANDNNKHF